MPLPNRQQVTSALFLALSMGSFYSIYIPLNTTNVHPVLVGTAFLHFTLVLLATICTYSDASDPAVKRSRNSTGTKQPLDLKQYPKYCTLCKTRVQATSRHCRLCNRCIAGFDHHCSWLNNCIGSGNYKCFVALVVVLQAVASAHVFAGANILSRVCNAEERSLLLEVTFPQQYRSPEVGYTVLVLMITLMSGWTVVFLLNGYLFCFHVFLCVRKQTAYDYLRARRWRARQVTPASELVSASVTPSGINATSDGKSTTVSPERIVVKFTAEEDVRRNGSMSMDENDVLSRLEGHVGDSRNS